MNLLGCAFDSRDLFWDLRQRQLQAQIAWQKRCAYPFWELVLKVATAVIDTAHVEAWPCLHGGHVSWIANLTDPHQTEHSR